MRQAVNLANGSTLAGLGVAALGRARLARGADGLFTGTGYRLPVPPAPAFCLGNVIVTRMDALDRGLGRCSATRPGTPPSTPGAAGWSMVPLYLVAAGVSWVLTGDFGAAQRVRAAGRAWPTAATPTSRCGPASGERLERAGRSAGSAAPGRTAAAHWAALSRAGPSRT